ncbi:DUF397 domain-containing protein [Kitasatospora sp. NPDC047058]|uniref:DUF397 domain-containing protein n=1 Tax=Kitasatospora sp. NPDC047058 TaxID=3155620 RepID=UPI0033FA91AE
MEALQWKRPEACANANNCPEVAITPGAVFLRSSLQPDAIARLTKTEWHNLLAGIRNGEFDA